MPLIRAENAPQFRWPGLSVTGLAAPSRGARETSVWRLCLEPGAPGAPHSLDHEEIFVALSGRARALVGGEESLLHAGDTLIVPAGERFSLRCEGSEPFEALAVSPAGVQALLPDGSRLVPPWTE